MKRDSFILHAKQLKNIEKLTDAQAGQLLKAIFRHSQEQSVDEMDDVVDMLYGIIADQMDDDTQKYQDVIEKRAKAGRASAEARANKKEQEATKSTSVQSVQHNPTDSTDNDNDNDNDNDAINISASAKKKVGKTAYGKYGHVKLTKAQYDDCVSTYGRGETDFLIEEVDSYCERCAKSYKNYREAIATFVKRGSLKEYTSRSGTTGSLLTKSINKMKGNEL